LSGGVGVTGLTVGDVDASPHNAGGLQISNSNNEKIVLSGSTDPFIRFQEGTNDKAYIQWNDSGYLDFRNMESGEFKFQSTVDGQASELILIRNDTTTATGNDLGSINFGHTDGAPDWPSQWVTQLPARIVAEASETTGSGDDGARLRFFTKNSSVNKDVDSIESMRLEHNGDAVFYHELSVPNTIVHSGDTDTYIQFHAADQFRVVTGGSERLEVNNNRTQIDNLEVTGTATFNGTVVGASAFNPLAVSGATPSLDLGSYNFFEQGVLTANTTVSFASVPTEAKWSYSFEPTVLSDEWDISTASFLQVSVDLGMSAPQGLFFKPDGTKMYVVGSTADRVRVYDLSTAWNVTTASYVQNFSVAGQETGPTGVFFSTDGTNMYVVGVTGDDVNQYSLSTAWNVTTASYVRRKTVAAQETSPQGLFFKSDGTKMYVVGASGNDIGQYNLSTAWNVSTASFAANKVISAQDGNPTAVFFKPDGLTMYVTGTNLDDVFEYDLSTAWAVNTASYVQNFSVGGQDSAPSGIFFKPDGLKMYVLGTSGDDVNEYDLGTDTTLTLPASIENPSTQPLARGTRVIYDFLTLDGGTTVTLVGEVVI
jgi:DNA-binding beta-propeller fold protein YncE